MSSALTAVERAMSLNASSATAFNFGALIHAFAGHPAAAMSNANRALRLSPFDPFAFVAHLSLGIAAVQETRYDEAASHFSKAVQANPACRYMFHAASLALAGRLEEAESPVRQLLELEPQFRVRRLISGVRLAREVADKLVKGVSMLGLPE